MSQSLDTKTKNHRLVGLDLFRILAAFVIFLFHSGRVACEYWGIYGFVKMGPIFMTGFFLLSGFSLYYSYQTADMTKLDAIKLFYKKRFASIMPVYWFLGVLYILFLGTESILQNIVLLPTELVGLQAAFSSLYLYSHNSATWFISCILFCYLIFPFLLECVKQMSARARLMLMMFAGAFLLYSPFVVNMFEQLSTYANPVFRLMEFFIGMILASFAEEMQGRAAIRKVLSSKIVLLLELAALVEGVKLLYGLGIGIGDYMLYSWIALPIFCLMLFGLAQASFPVLEKSKTIRYLSSISYVFFLAQFFTWPVTGKIVEITGYNSTLFKCTVSLAICLAISVLMYEAVEKPCRRFLLRFPKEPEKTGK